MKQIEDDCVDCGLPCLGVACPYKKAAHWYCDECGSEMDPQDLYLFEGREICEDCLKEILLERVLASGEAEQGVNND